MGFTTGFLGGLTLTYSLLYLSVYVHRSNRTHQSLLLRQQARLLNSNIDPPESEYEPPTYRTEQAGLEEQLKDRWNREVEKLTRAAQETDWEALRIRWEQRIGNAFDKLRNTEKAQELEQKVRDTASELEQTVKDKSEEFGQQAKNKAQELKQQVTEKSRDLGQQVQDQSQVLSKQVRDQSQVLAQQIKDKSQDISQQVKDKAHDLGQQVKDAVASTNAPSPSRDVQQSTKELLQGKRLLDVE